MPRLHSIDPANATGKAKEIFDGPLKGKHLNIFKGMANSPHVLNMYLKMNQALDGISLSMKEAETVQLAAANAAGCDYCQAAHSVIGKDHGLTDAEILGARKGHIEGDPRMDAVAAFTKAFVDARGYVSDDQLEKFKGAGFDDQAVVEVVGLIALANLTNTFNNLHETVVDFPAIEKV